MKKKGKEKRKKKKGESEKEKEREREREFVNQYHYFLNGKQMRKWQLNVRQGGINITLLCKYIAEIDVNIGESNTVIAYC